MFDIIAIGSATKDIFIEAAELKSGRELRFPLGQKIELDKVRQFFGGGGLNAAVTFIRQGLKTAFCGVVGQDLAGQEILDELQQKGIETELMRIKSRISTDLGLIFHAGQERTILLYHSASRAFLEKDIDWQKMAQTKWLYLAPLWGPAAKLSEKLLSLAKQRRIKTAMNPSLDQLKLKNTWQTLKNVDVLLLNDDEASFLTGVKPYQETKIFSQIGARLSLAPEQIVVITKGKGGATAFDGKFVYQVEAPLVEVIDATGAGDSFGSGLVAGLIQNRGRSDLPRALRLAMANAVSNIQVFGANKGLLKIHDKLPEIKITQTVL